MATESSHARDPGQNMDIKTLTTSGFVHEKCSWGLGRRDRPPGLPSIGLPFALWQSADRGLLKRSDRGRVNYWKLKLYLRAELECRGFGLVRPLIWWIWVGFRPPAAVATDMRADSTSIRRCFALPPSYSTLFRHCCDIPVVNLVPVSSGFHVTLKRPIRAL